MALNVETSWSPYHRFQSDITINCVVSIVCCVYHVCRKWCLVVYRIWTELNVFTQKSVATRVLGATAADRRLSSWEFEISSKRWRFLTCGKLPDAIFDSNQLIIGHCKQQTSCSKTPLRRSVLEVNFKDGSSPGPIVNRITCSPAPLNLHLFTSPSSKRGKKRWPPRHWSFTGMTLRRRASSSFTLKLRNILEQK